MALCHSCINEMELQQGKFSHYAACPGCEQPNNLYDTLPETIEVHINELEVGDKINHFAGLIATITYTEPTGKGHQRIFGYYDGEESNPHLLEQTNCYLNKVIE